MAESTVINSENNWCTVILASECVDNNFNNEFDSAKLALQPFGGVSILDHWLRSLRTAGLTDIYVLCNVPCYSHLVDWAMTRGLPASHILKDDYVSESWMITLLRSCQENNADSIRQNLLIVRGNTLPRSDFNLSLLLSELPSNKDSIFYNDLGHFPSACNISDWKIDMSTFDVGSLLGTPLISAYRSVTFPLILEFMKSSTEFSNIPVKIINWLRQKKSEIQAFQANGLFIIDNEAAFVAAEGYFTESLVDQVALLPRTVTHFCPARVGLMGNPSDGFGGKTLSFLISNFNAQVTIKENHEVTAGGSRSSSSSYRDVTLVPHPVLDPSSFCNMGYLQLHTINKGYYGGIRLLQATCKSFSEICLNAGILIHLQRGFIMSYDTDIPRMVGLSGSSAIVVAAFEALMDYYGLTLRDLNIEKSHFPRVILDIERVELGIACGLQDRVVQTYGGLVHMDFTASGVGDGVMTGVPTGTIDNGVYAVQDVGLLPPMYLAYNINAGSDSGKVHSTVKARWQARDPTLVAGMVALGKLADSALECLLQKNTQGLAELMDRNFAFRRELYGDGPVGVLNISMVELAVSLGLSAKFTGSGGALLCLQRNGQGWLTEAGEKEAFEAFKRHGFRFVRVEVA